MISHDFKTIFIHIPKTGGTSIEYSLCNVKEKVQRWKHKPDHSVAKDYFIDNPGEYWGYHKVTVVRDPVEREASLYKFMAGTRNFKGHTFLDYLNNLNKDKSFYARKGRRLMNLYSDQVDYIMFGNQICIDQIIRFEDLQGGYDLLCEKIKKEKSILPHARKTKRVVTPNAEEIALIKEVRKRDYEMLGYS